MAWTGAELRGLLRTAVRLSIRIGRRANRRRVCRACAWVSDRAGAGLGHGWTDVRCVLWHME